MRSEPAEYRLPVDGPEVRIGDSRPSGVLHAEVVVDRMMEFSACSPGNAPSCESMRGRAGNELLYLATGEMAQPGAGPIGGAERVYQD